VLSAANSEVKFDPNEPDGPSIKTAVPGPKSLQRLEELSRIQVMNFDLVSHNLILDLLEQ